MLAFWLGSRVRYQSPAGCEANIEQLFQHPHLRLIAVLVACVLGIYLHESAIKLSLSFIV